MQGWPYQLKLLQPPYWSAMGSILAHDIICVINCYLAKFGETAIAFLQRYKIKSRIDF